MQNEVFNNSVRKEGGKERLHIIQPQTADSMYHRLYHVANFSSKVLQLDDL